MRPPLVVLIEEAPQPLFRFEPIAEVQDIPELAPQRADGAFDFAATARAIRPADNMVNELGLQVSTEVCLLGESHEGAAPVGAHSLRFAMPRNRSPQRLGRHRA